MVIVKAVVLEATPVLVAPAPMAKQAALLSTHATGAASPARAALVSQLAVSQVPASVPGKGGVTLLG
jgi:hypothetical protein